MEGVEQFRERDRGGIAAGSCNGDRGARGWGALAMMAHAGGLEATVRGGGPVDTACVGGAAATTRGGGPVDTTRAGGAEATARGGGPVDTAREGGEAAVALSTVGFSGPQADGPPRKSVIHIGKLKIVPHCSLNCAHTCL